MTPIVFFVLLMQAPRPPLETPDDLSTQLVAVKRVYVDRMTGGETAAQMRDLLITSVHNSRLFVITANPERADAILRGAAEDLIFTATSASSEGINVHAGGADSSANSSSSRFNGAGGSSGQRSSRSAN